ncbi:transmembrane protein 200A [Colossoma macropomum]|uniref:transmembrane protein 200A n=1 Tax=Colossoma macropomum TaxID=42526 RepID=UPI001863EF8F|nr:transmembrane protein 200A [Colossoma macropomum]XP_036422944.1 transmembrane protein 200A [Colossoma macropomum]XP_036422945.1 transmembrane protein 200A [Colossoma macropomum]
MRTQKTQGQTPSVPSHQRLPHFSLCSRKKKEGVIQGKLRIRSIPGAFLVLGMVVVIVGTALAVAGYWPYRVQRSALGAVSDSLPGTSQASGWGLGAKGLFSTASLIHSERMKLLGPVIMGVGLFILICANTVLFENRDRETQMLLAQMRSVICSVSTAVPTADFTQVNTLARHYQWVSSLPTAHLNILCLQELASSEPLLQVKITEEEGGSQQRAILRTEVLHHQESSSTPSIHSSNSCNSSKVDFNTITDAEQGVSCGQQPQPEIHCKLSICLTASSMSTLEGEDWELSILPPRRSHSVNYRTKPHSLPTALILEDRAEQSTDNPRELQRQSSSNICVNMTRVGTVTLDLAHMEEQKHRSWPRLDLGYTRRYLKLENKEDSVDKLLDQLEQQCSQLDKSFGSGPFQ